MEEIIGQGKGKFQIKLGPIQLEIDAIVADIDDDGLLGVDVLQNGSWWSDGLTVE